MNNVDISVVIPVKNGWKYLDSLLRAVFSQKINSGFEVIIIDTGSIDKSLNIIRRYPVSLYQINEKSFNHGLTRNLGISKANGKYIILLTQDAIPFDSYWMKRLIDSLEKDERVAGVYSRHIPHKDCCFLARIMVSRFFTSETKRREGRIDKIEDYNKLSPEEKYRLCNFNNVSSCIRKSIWQVIPFSETDFGEDLEWSKKVLEAGYKIIYEPDSIVYHSHDFSVSEWYERNRINYKKLHSLFGINKISNIYKLLAYSAFYTIRDFYCLFYYERRIKSILSSFYLIPIFSFFGALGQYRGLRGS